MPPDRSMLGSARGVQNHLDEQLASAHRSDDGLEHLGRTSDADALRSVKPTTGTASGARDDGPHCSHTGMSSTQHGYRVTDAHTPSSKTAAAQPPGTAITPRSLTPVRCKPAGAFPCDARANNVRMVKDNAALRTLPRSVEPGFTSVQFSSGAPAYRRDFCKRRPSSTPDPDQDPSVSDSATPSRKRSSPDRTVCSRVRPVPGPEVLH